MKKKDNKETKAKEPEVVLKKRVTLASNVSCEMEERKSIFIGHAAPVRSEEEARMFIEAKRKEYHDATHNVYAYMLNGGAIARYYDDGEPQGTAGMPVLNVLKMSGACDLCVVVTRYFGGILLGAGGLVRAYGAAAKNAVDAAGLAVFEQYALMKIVDLFLRLVERCLNLLRGESHEKVIYQLDIALEEIIHGFVACRNRNI